MEARMAIYLYDREVMLGQETSQKPGKTYLYISFQGIESVRMPDAPTMERLVRDFLGGNYEEALRLHNFLAFHVDSEISREKKASLHAAVCTHIRMVEP